MLVTLPTLGHELHRRAKSTTDVEAVHAGAKSDGGKDLRGRLLPHSGLIAQTLIALGVAHARSRRG